MYRILILSPVYWPYHLGGAEISTKLLAEGLNACEEFQVEVFTHGEDAGDSNDNVGGVPVRRHCFPFFSKNIFNAIHNRPNSGISNKITRLFGTMLALPGRCRFYCRLFKQYDLVMLSGNGIGMGRRDMWKAAKKEQVPFVQIIRDSDLVYIRSQECNVPVLDRIYRFVCTRGLSDVPHIVGVSKRILDLHTSHGIRFKEEKVIYNAVDDKLCRKLPYGEKQNIILYVGTIGKYKGCQTLIQAFQRIEAEIPDYTLMLIGKNIDVEIPQDERIIVKGKLELQEAYRYMQMAKLLVLPSEWDEAFGRVLVEAIYNGTLAVGSDAGAIPELFDHDPRYVFPQKDADQLSEKLERVINLSEQDYVAELTEMQGRWAKFSVENYVSAWKKYCMEAIGLNGKNNRPGR